MHPQGIAIIADSRKMRGREIVSERSRKVFVFERVVVLHAGFAGQEGELEALMFRLEIRAKEWDAQSLAWTLLEEAEQIWGERAGRCEAETGEREKKGRRGWPIVETTHTEMGWLVK
ncbi:MAG: hypothetical protein ACP5QU_10405 [Anaerolineae bacterium]